MAGYTRLYVIGAGAGFMGADGVNPIELLILLGEGDRHWLEPHYFNSDLKPLGNLRVIVPAGPNDPNAVLDACIAFCPSHFESCPSLAEVEAALGDTQRLEFDAEPTRIPAAWDQLRKEAQPLFSQMGLWEADLVPVAR